MTRKFVAGFVLATALTFGSAAFTPAVYGCGSTGGAGNCRTVTTTTSTTSTDETTDDASGWIVWFGSLLFG